MDTLIVLVIVAAAAVYLFLRLTGRLSSGKSGCGCGCDCGDGGKSGPGTCDVPAGSIRPGEAGNGEAGDDSPARGGGEPSSNRPE